MTSPYSSNLLQQPVEGRERPAAPRPFAASRSVTQVVAAPQAPVPMPQQPMYVAAPASPSGSRLTPVLLALLVILIGAVSLVAGYYATTQAAPSAAERALDEQLSAEAGFRSARASGLEQGRTDALAASDATGRLRAATVAQAAYQRAFARGRSAGLRAYQRPSYGGGYRASSGPRISFPRGGEIVSAFGTAQRLANATGAPVDVEIY